jgi:site-specific DNA recombinase
MSKEEIAAIVNAITSLMTVLRDADPHDKAEIYGQLGLRLTYHPSPRTVSARAEPGRPCTKGSCPRGDLNPHFGVRIRMHPIPFRRHLTSPDG